jgi:hypothetical protein
MSTCTAYAMQTCLLDLLQSDLPAPIIIKNQDKESESHFLSNKLDLIPKFTMFGNTEDDSKGRAAKSKKGAIEEI